MGNLKLNLSIKNIDQFVLEDSGNVDWAQQGDLELIWSDQFSRRSCPFSVQNNHNGTKVLNSKRLLLKIKICSPYLIVSSPVTCERASWPIALGDSYFTGVNVAVAGVPAHLINGSDRPTVICFHTRNLSVLCLVFVQQLKRILVDAFL